MFRSRNSFAQFILQTACVGVLFSLLIADLRSKANKMFGYAEEIKMCLSIKRETDVK